MHDGTVNPVLGADVSGGFVLGHILADASYLMIALLVVAGDAGVPQGDVVSAGETVVLVIVILVGVGRLRTAPSSCSTARGMACMYVAENIFS